MYPSVFNSFPVIRTASAKVAVFTYRSPHFCLSQCVSPKIAIFCRIFVFPGDAPGAIMLNVVWMEREFDAYKLSRSMYLSIFNSFPDIRTASAKNRRFHVPQPRFLCPLETPLRLSRNMLHGWKANSMLAKLLQHVPIYLQQFPSYTMLKSMRKSKNRHFYHIFVSPGDAPGAITLNVV